MTQSREQRLVDTFVTLADTLVDDYDVIELLQMLVGKAADLFDVTAAGIMLATRTDELELVASTSERSNLVGVMQLDAGEGPCVEAYRTGRVVTVGSTAELRRRWPAFAAASERFGYASVHAIPLRLRDETLGSMNLYRERPGALGDEDIVAAQALTDVATISILQQRGLERATIARDQLQRALDSRVVIEQAKGFLAQTHEVDMDQAFVMLRSYARSHQVPLAETARQVVERTVSI
ncbi:transcriptional regulator [Curtobacterium sp. MCJR17_055]|uniref:GAF and ANTAR domain-containing protein n=1 Tax=unclassified Curtobacterium TaxID=257496 RepID=UPI000DA0EFF0|nr:MULTISPECIES: GAF and ANTAR domain-containing protein [unclassified Curtobacterium]PYY33792.1 transcriptional regulator [Curtobacterium sp. MCBD17_029]PYY58738.1 transcriptional regulator [Curtobacterium sp. MCJR17_055]PYY59721.1 transcriptional regulator [Curtobacterium sp. MCPF17_015]PZE91718.1 transcriptional regulator [Curtobacterium sp. MCBD17_008]WIB36386.1 GAF and ANTAR domain-containing protein [Curtobacterium sp. MCJR17_043]